jgi:hypothetical protein
MPCVWSQVFKKMFKKTPYNFQVRTTDSCATVWTSLWRRLEALQCLADYVEDVLTTEQHRSDARSIIILHWVGFQKLSQLGKSLQVVRTRWQHVRTLSSILEYYSVPFKCGKELYQRPSGHSTKPSGRGPDKDRIALFLKGDRRRPSERGYLPSGHSTARVRISADLGIL